VAVRYATSAKVARDAKRSLLADFRALAHELPGIALVVEILILFEPAENPLNGFLVFGAKFQLGTHLVHRIRAARQAVDRGGVNLGLAGKFAGRGAHEGSIEGEGKEVKEVEELKEVEEVREVEELEETWVWNLKFKFEIQKPKT
jgi:hypothetical protein